MKRFTSILFFTLLCLTPAFAASKCPVEAKKIVLIAGKKSHGPGFHEYVKDLQLLKYCLDTSLNVKGIKTELHLNGWPKDPNTLNDADTIVLFSDGADRNEQAHPFMVGDRMKIIEKQMNRACGLVLQHYSTFVPKKVGDKFLEWVGGYFDYESGPPPRNWYSQIKWHTSTPKLASPQHSISRGLRPFKLKEEYYYNIQFGQNDSSLMPILTTPIPGESKPQVVAWALERKNSGRGFATTVGHTHTNFQLPDFRKMHLNAIIWTAGLEVPPGGVESTLPPDWKFESLPATWDPKQIINEKPIRALLITGNDHPGHKWRQTTPALLEALWQDKRFLVDVTYDPEMLARADLSCYDLLVLHYCNWKSPGLSDKAKQAFVDYLSGGGGLSIIHFANGAFHFSLPGAAQSDWPEYRKICARTWNHKGESGHDSYGRFRINTTNVKHPITEAMESFETVDELYYKQEGDVPIKVLAIAHSKNTDQDEPIAWVYMYGKGRVFQTVLGHSAQSIRMKGPAKLICRGSIWAAGRNQN